MPSHRRGSRKKPGNQIEDKNTKALNYQEAMRVVQDQSISRRVYKVIALLIPFLGTAFLWWYIKGASIDIVYSDYIRLINNYLPDTLSGKSFFVADIFTRIPITYPIRWLNVEFFSYSVDFDRFLGLLGVFVTMMILGIYIIRERVGVLASIALVLAGFSLNKWELLINGSGYPHFLSYGLFFYNYLLLERVFTGTKKSYDDVKLTVLPFIALLVSGPYIVQYVVTLIVTSFYLAYIKNRNVDKNRIPIYIITTTIPLIIFLWSNNKSDYEYALTEDITLMEVLTQKTGFAVHFLLNGFASLVIDGDRYESMLSTGTITYRSIYLIGAFVILSYVVALILYFGKGIYKRTIFPFILMISGAGSHVLVFLSRYIFVRETYAWQSRYSLQYLPGVLGMLIIYGMVFSDWYEKYSINRLKDKKIIKESRRRRRSRIGVITCVMVLVSVIVPMFFIAGNCYVIKKEIANMPYRKAYFEAMKETALHIDDYTDDELNSIFEYNHGANKVRYAFSVLKDNNLNIYSTK